MHAIRLAPPTDARSLAARARVLGAAADGDARHLMALWEDLSGAVRPQLRIDEALRDAVDDYAEALQRRLAAGTDAERRRAVADLRHHAAMLEDLLASSISAAGARRRTRPRARSAARSGAGLP